MNGFVVLLQLFFVNHQKIAKKTELRGEIVSYLDDLNITKNDYTDTTAELEDMLTNRHFLKRVIVDGSDQRFTGEKNDEILRQFMLNLYKYNLLKTLENPLLSQMHKIEYIEEYEKMNDEKNSKYMSEIFKGIVFSDW